MINRYRYFAVMSLAVLAYFLLTSQYLYHELAGRHSLLFPILSNNSQVINPLSTSMLKSISTEMDLDATDPATKWFSVIKNATSKFFNLQSGQDLPKFRTWAVEVESKFLKDEMRSFSFQMNKSLSDFVMEHGGEPVRNLVVTTWRSGSTFLGEMLHSHPGMYYHYESLLHFGVVQVSLINPQHLINLAKEVSDIGGVSSTFRDTKSAPFHWVQVYSSNFTVVETIQSCCRKAMALWGYAVLESQDKSKGFNPLMDPPWDDMNIPPDE